MGEVHQFLGAIAEVVVRVRFVEAAEGEDAFPNGRHDSTVD